MAAASISTTVGGVTTARSPSPPTINDRTTRFDAAAAPAPGCFRGRPSRNSPCQLVRLILTILGQTRLSLHSRWGFSCSSAAASPAPCDRVLAATIAFSAAAPPHAGVGDLLVAPTRVVLDGRRGTEIILNNIGDDVATYRVSVELRRMKPGRHAGVGHHPNAHKERPPGDGPLRPAQGHPSAQPAAVDPRQRRPRRRASPTANIASTCCSARFPIQAGDRHCAQGRASRSADPDLRRDHPGHRPPRQPRGQGRDRQRPQGREGGKPAIAVDLTRTATARPSARCASPRRGSKSRSPWPAESRSTPKSASAAVTVPIDAALRQPGDRRGHRRISRKDPTGPSRSPKPARSCVKPAGGRGPPALVRDWIRQRRMLAALACAGAVTAVAGPGAVRGRPRDRNICSTSISASCGSATACAAIPTPEGACLAARRHRHRARPAADDRPQGAHRHRLGVPRRQSPRHRPAAATVGSAPAAELRPTAVRETPEGWCVDSGALGRWFGCRRQAAPFASVLTLDIRGEAPVELAIERALRARHVKPAAAVRRPAPGQACLSLVARSGARLHGQRRRRPITPISGMRVDRRASVLAAGEIAACPMTPPSPATAGARRPAPLQGLSLGSGRRAARPARRHPLRDRRRCRPGQAGLAAGGAAAAPKSPTEPLFNPIAFDRPGSKGTCPRLGRRALPQRGTMVAFADQFKRRYAFEDVQLIYGDNRFEIILYGPQGQQRVGIEISTSGRSTCRPARLWYGPGQPAGHRPAGVRRSRTPQRPVRAPPAVPCPGLRPRSVEHGSTSGPRVRHRSRE